MKITKKDIPDNWKIKSLQEIADISGGKAFKSSNYITGNKKFVYLIRISDIQDNLVKTNKAKKLPLKFYNNNKKYKLNKNDILVALSGATAGKAGIYRNDEEKSLLNQRIAKIRAGNSINKKFLYYWVISEHFLFNELRKNNSSAQTNISMKEIKKSKIPTPPLPEQEKIVEKLDRIFEKINSIREADNRSKEIENDFLQSFIHGLIESEINRCSWKRIQKTVEYHSNSINPQNYPEKEFNYIGLKNIEKETGNFINIKKTEGKKIKSAKRKFDSSYILYGKLRPYLNKVASPNFEGICSTDIILFRPKKGYNKDFIKYCLLSNRIKNKAKQLMTGANHPRISKSKLLNFKIPTPPLKEQEKIVNKIQRIEEKVKNIKKKNKDREKKIDKLSKSILNKAFTSELL